MSPFILGYIVLVILVIVGINFMARRSKSVKALDRKMDEERLTRSGTRSGRRNKKKTADQPKKDVAREEPQMKEKPANEHEKNVNQHEENAQHQEENTQHEENAQQHEHMEPKREKQEENEAMVMASEQDDVGAETPKPETPARAEEAVNEEKLPDKEKAPGKEKREKKPKIKSKRSDIIDPRSVHPVSIVAVLILGAFTAILNQTLLNVALPKIQTDLGVSYNTVQWLVTGYMLVNGVLIPITAFLMESFTTRQLFIFAMSSFGVGTLFCAVSPTFSILLVGRLVQGIGAGIIMPLMTNVMLTIFPPEKRGAAMGTMGVAMIFAPAIGPTLSGWIVENYSWRILFYMITPVILVDILLAFIFLKNIRKLTFPKLDIFGVILSTIGFGGVLYGFSEAGSAGWGATKVILSLLIGFIALIALVWRQLTISNPILEFRVFKYNIFALTTVVNAIITMAMFAGMVLTPIYLQNIRGFTPLQSGLLLLPGAILMGIMSPVTGILYDKIGARPLAIVGLTITAITTWEFGHLTDATTYDHIMVLYSFRMFGLSMLMMPIMTEGLNNLPPKYYSYGTAMSNTMRQVAGSLGTALLVSVMTNRSSFHTATYQNTMSQTNHFLSTKLHMMGQGLAATLHLPTQQTTGVLIDMLYGQAVKEGMIQGIDDAFIVASGLAVLALILSFFVKRSVPAKPKKPKTEKAGQTGLPVPSPSEELATDQ